MRLVSVLLVAACAPPGSVAPAPAPSTPSVGSTPTSMPDPTSEETDETAVSYDWEPTRAFVEEQRALGNIPGLAVAVVVGDQVVFAEGFGVRDVEAGLPVTAHTPFMIASVSKVVAATTLMQIVEAGQLTLDDVAEDHIDFVLDNPALTGEVITVRDLVTHTSTLRDNWALYGWPGWPGEEGYVEGDSQMALGDYLADVFVVGGERYDASENFYSAFGPGEAYRYSNFGSAMAAHVAEAASGVAFDDHGDAHLFGPLGMTNTGWHLADHEVSEVAVPTSYDGPTPTTWGHYGYADYPAGQLRSSAADMGRFMAMYLAGGALDGARILEPETIAAMWAPQTTATNLDQGVFWYWADYRGRPTVTHSGSDYGVLAQLHIDPAAGVGIVVIGNTDWRDDSTAAVIDIERELFEAADDYAATVGQR